jgi:hypothetical protein
MFCVNFHYKQCGSGKSAGKFIHLIIGFGIFFVLSLLFLAANTTTIIIIITTQQYSRYFTSPALSYYN